MRRKFNSSKLVWAASITVASAATMALFQNCSGQMGFKQSQQASVSQTINIGSELPPNHNTPVVEDQKFSCNQYIEITADQFSIPSRDQRGLCYYKKLFTGVGQNKSSNYSEAAEGVDFQKPLFIQEELGLIINLQGERKTIISGAIEEEKSFLIDNFVLLEVTGSQSEFVGWSYFYEKTMLVYNKAQQIVPKTIYITQYTNDDAKVKAWDISNKLSLNQNLNINLSTLDNGGAYQVSNMYIVFK